MASQLYERNPNAPLRLLSLDGGGVRGLSSLMVLEDLMENIAEEEKRLGLRDRNDESRLKPCDYFDLIGGTSTGGIIAVLLGRLGLDCRQCIDIYTELAEKIFKNDRVIKIFGTKIPLSANRFSGAVLEKAIKSALVKLGYQEDELMWDAKLFEQVDDPEQEIPDDNIWANLRSPRDRQNFPPPLTESPVETRSRSTSTLAKSAATSTVALDSAPKRQVINEPQDNSANKSKVSRRGTQLSQRNLKISPSATERKPTFRLHRTGSVHQKAGQRGCRAFVVSTLKNALGAPRIFTTYDANDHTTKIWEALRATSAAPTFFEEISFGKPQMTYLDGGVGFNNPCAEVDYAAKSLWEGRPIGCIVSVGTGLQTIPSVKKANTWLPFGLGTDIALAGALASMATGTARVDNEMQRMYYHTGTKYHRFDVDGGIANISMEEFMREDEMGALTEQYMRDPQQVRRARHLGELMVRLAAMPPRFEIAASQFRIGMDGRGVINGSFVMEELDFKTGFPLGWKVSATDAVRMSEIRSSSPSGRGGAAVDDQGRPKKIFPVAEDLDGDGRPEEAVVTTCKRSDNVFLRALRTGIPQGKYHARFVVCFFEPSESPAGTVNDDEEPSKLVPPTELVFSVGKPYDAATFLHRYVDVRITPDAVPVLLHPDAVRVRVGRKRFADRKGKGWLEIEGDVDVTVGLDGALGFIVSRRFDEDAVSGWSFGGVQLEPVFTDSRRKSQQV
ncbi:MAG: hypothetical protein M1822_004657 [Bathelium mastoideum]|nr:MAG: hypothetical protein M1822_004657 [Bathelium mastoideum]